MNESTKASIQRPRRECRPKKCRSASWSVLSTSLRMNVLLCACLCVWLCFSPNCTYVLVRTGKCVCAGCVYLINTIWIQLHSSFFSLRLGFSFLWICFGDACACACVLVCVYERDCLTYARLNNKTDIHGISV